MSLFNMCNTHGFIVLIIGPMFSGKTTALKEYFDRFTIAGKKCLMVKYSADTRYDADKVKTHAGIVCTGTTIKSSLLKDIEENIKEYDVICIDEIQFYNDAPKYCDKWANDGKIIICSGLTGTFQRKPFPIISELIPLSEQIIHKHAICAETGCDASFSFKTSNSQNVVEIGGSDLYKAVDRDTFNALTSKKA